MTIRRSDDLIRIGVMSVNGPDFHPNRRLIASAREKGCRVVLINPYHMLTAIEAGIFHASFYPEIPRPDIILPRQGAPMGDYGLTLLRQFRHMGIPLVNGLEGVTLARSQFLTLQALSGAGLPVPDSCFITAQEGCYRAVQRMGGYPVIAKQMDGMGGDGVIKLEDDAGVPDLCRSLPEHKKGLLIQEFFPPEGRTDYRVLVVGGSVVGAMALTPRKGEFRSNIHQQGQSRPVDPTPSLQEPALSAARACRLDIAGVDLMVTKNGRTVISEVNYSPGFRGLEAATGIDAAGRIIDLALERLNRIPGSSI